MCKLQEDKLLLELHLRHGSDWKGIAAAMNGARDHKQVRERLVFSSSSSPSSSLLSTPFFSILFFSVSRAMKTRPSLTMNIYFQRLLYRYVNHLDPSSMFSHQSFNLVFFSCPSESDYLFSFCTSPCYYIVNHDRFSIEEQRALVKWNKIQGPQWAVFARRMRNGDGFRRTALQVKNFFHRTACRKNKRQKDAPMEQQAAVD